MKTPLQTLFTAALTAIVLTTSAFSGQAKEIIPATAASPSTISYNKVVVTGTAKVVLIQSKTESVVCNRELDENTTVTKKGYVLHIHSTAKSPSTVYVYVKDLHRIDASNTAVVKTRGDFNLDFLQIFLQQDAQANVNAKVGSLYTDMKGRSDLVLKGSSKEHMLVRNEVATLDVSSFVIAKL